MKKKKYQDTSGVEGKIIVCKGLVWVSVFKSWVFWNLAHSNTQLNARFLKNINTLLCNDQKKENTDSHALAPEGELRRERHRNTLFRTL